MHIVPEGGESARPAAAGRVSVDIGGGKWYI